MWRHPARQSLRKVMLHTPVSLSSWGSEGCGVWFRVIDAAKEKKNQRLLFLRQSHGARGARGARGGWVL